MQKSVFAVAAAVCLFFVGAAHAASVSYDLTLTNTYGSAGGGNGGGTGAFTLSGAPAATGTSHFSDSAGSLTALSFSLDEGFYGDPVNFDLSDASYLDNPTVSFHNGSVSAIDYIGTDPNGFFTLYLDTDDMSYTVKNILGVTVDGGTLTATLDAPAAPTPEPGSIALLGTGLTALGGLVRRRRLSRA